MSKTELRNYDFEPVDDTPVSIPTRLKLPQSRTEQMRQFIRHELSLQATEQGNESFEEADDFEIDEDDLPITPYEMLDLEPPVPAAPPVSAKPVEGEALPPVDPAAPPSKVASDGS